MKDYECDWDTTRAGSGDPLYGWYYVTQAMYHAAPDPSKSASWRYWNPKISATLVENQQGDGHWTLPDGAPGVVKRTMSSSVKNESVYATVMCCLMLEVYYRYGGALEAYR